VRRHKSAIYKSITFYIYYVPSRSNLELKRICHDVSTLLLLDVGLLLAQVLLIRS